jgi:hypothetical protein
MQKLHAWLIGAAAVAVLSLIAFISIVGTELKISFTEAELQTKLTEALATSPHDQFALSDLTVKLHDNEATVTAQASGEYMGKRVRASLTLVGQPVYDGGAFYFELTQAPQAEVIIEPTSKAAAPEALGAFSTTKKLLALRLKKTVADAELTEVVETFKAELRTWFVGKAETVVVGAFKRHPLYTLPQDGKNLVVRAVLNDVAVTDGKLVITLSLLTLGAHLLYLGLFLIALFGIGALMTMQFHTIEEGNRGS